MKKKLIPIVLIVLFSIMLWVYVSFSGDYSITLKLPVEIENIPSGYALSSISTNSVSISIKGQGWQLAQNTLGRNPKFKVLCKGKKKKQKISVRNEFVNNPWLSSTLQIVEASPQNIELTIEQIKTKKVEVIPIVSYEFKPGYGLVSRIKVEPDSVVVIGPESKVEKIEFVQTKLEIFEKLDHSISEVIPLVKSKYLNYNIDRCKISFEVEKIVDKSIDNVPVETKGVPPSQQLVLTPNNIRVVLRGGINRLSKLSAKDIKAYVKFKDALKDTLGAIIPKIKIPDQTKLIDVKPMRLDYIIKKY